MTSNERQGAAGWRLRGLRGLAWCTSVLLVVALALGVLYLRTDEPEPPSVSADSSSELPDWPASPVIAPADWSALRAPTAAWMGSPAADGAAGSKYRLAGTFIVTAPEGGLSSATYRKAILDDIDSKTQHLLGEGEGVNDLRVVRVHADRVVVDVGGRMEILGLGFIGGAGDAPVPPSAVTADAEGKEPMESTRFGKRVDENRWLLERDSLMTYYRDVLESPERVALLYETFRPEYDDGKISGYRIDIQGEREFLNDVGLKEGDTVRMVNSMKMTSQSRAEFFLGEFVKERLNAVVLDIERDGQNRKIVYLIR